MEDQRKAIDALTIARATPLSTGNYTDASNASRPRSLKYQSRDYFQENPTQTEFPALAQGAKWSEVVERPKKRVRTNPAPTLCHTAREGISVKAEVNGRVTNEVRPKVVKSRPSAIVEDRHEGKLRNCVTGMRQTIRNQNQKSAATRGLPQIHHFNDAQYSSDKPPQV